MNRRGFALLLVLWTLVPVSALLVGLGSTARSDGALTFNLRDAARLEAAADGGIETAIFALLHPGATPPRLRLVIGGATIAVATEPLGGLVNPNVASFELLRAMLIRAGAEPARAEAIAAAILDWRTPGQRKRQNGAKAADYQAAGRAYGPPGAPFETIAELRDVLGMTEPLYAALRPHLSLFVAKPPDPALANGLVRDALADLGNVPRPGAGFGDTFRIDAVASTASGHEARRRAVIRFTAGNGRPWHVLSWESPG